MPVKHVTKEIFVNDFERRVFNAVRNWLEANRNNETWNLYSNVHIRCETRDPEIDLVAIGPDGIFLIEAKGKRGPVKEDELKGFAKQVTHVVYAVKDRLRLANIYPWTERGSNCPFLQAHLILQAEPFKDVCDDAFCWQLSSIEHDLSKLLGKSSYRLKGDDIDRVCEVIFPDGELKRVGASPKFPDIKLRQKTPIRVLADGFHRVYEGKAMKSKPTWLGLAIEIHFWDLTRVNIESPLMLVDREIDSLQDFQSFVPHVPKILQTRQDLLGYENELCFYSYGIPKSLSLFDKLRDQKECWLAKDRMQYAIAALATFSTIQDRFPRYVHRSLSLDSMRVTSKDTKVGGNVPVFTGFSTSRLPERTIAAASSEHFRPLDDYTSPEVKQRGWHAAVPLSDTFSLCKTLQELFKDSDDQSQRIYQVLSLGTTETEASRKPLREILGEICRVASPFGEGGKATLHGHEYLVEFFKEGSYGRVYKLNKKIGDRRFMYAGKSLFTEATFKNLADSLSKIQLLSTQTPHLASVFEWESTWTPLAINARFEWVDGISIAGYDRESFEREFDVEANVGLVREWAIGALSGLALLHEEKLVHRDISPANLIIRKDDPKVLTLIDYDQICDEGSESSCMGTERYTPPELKKGVKACPSDDVYSLAVSLFSFAVRDDRDSTFLEDDKKKGLNWEGIDNRCWRLLEPFFLKATHPKPDCRFANAMAARDFLARASEVPLAIQGYFKKHEAYCSTAQLERSAPGVFASTPRNPAAPDLFQGSFIDPDLGEVTIAISTTKKTLYRVGIDLEKLILAFATQTSSGFERAYGSCDELTSELKKEFPHAKCVSPITVDYRDDNVRLEQANHGVKVRHR